MGGRGNPLANLGDLSLVARCGEEGGPLGVIEPISVVPSVHYHIAWSILDSRRLPGYVCLFLQEVSYWTSVRSFVAAYEISSLSFASSFSQAGSY